MITWSCSLPVAGVREKSPCKSVKHAEECVFEADAETEGLHVLGSMSKEEVMFWDERAALHVTRILFCCEGLSQRVSFWNCWSTGKVFFYNSRTTNCKEGGLRLFICVCLCQNVLWNNVALPYIIFAVAAGISFVCYTALLVLSLGRGLVCQHFFNRRQPFCWGHLNMVL